ncbi:uncharacterized protein LOC111612983 [Centruroides sculpturatus]|uniref:uncharacterized protein LOC111612983 n=1 Tax=Centruroides sculpturatus TaxID=218467 RepID=UPI000C6DAD60|nr:uncharacterized protein LOC111612983 [Centruroides sculpturatus]
MARRGVICAMYGCFNYKIQSDRKSFYRFPKNKQVCTQWIVKSRRSDLDNILRTKGPEYLNRNYVMCSDHFTKKDGEFSHREMGNFHIEMKKYDDNCRMLYPNGCGKKLSSEMSAIFQNNFNIFLLQSPYGIKTKLINYFLKNANIKGVCDNCIKLLADKYFKVLIKAYVTKNNDSSESFLRTKNAKLKKIAHM